VLPDVGSTIVPPGRSRPSRSAASMSAMATRSVTEPPGLSDSTFATSCGVSSAPMRLSRTSGELAGHLRGYNGRSVVVGVRPESLTEPSASGAAHLAARVVQTEQLGPEVLVHAELDAAPVTTDEVREVAADVDAAALADLARSVTARSTTILARFGPRADPRAGDLVQLTVDLEGLHFFDLESQEAIGRTVPPVASAAAADERKPY